MKRASEQPPQGLRVAMAIAVTILIGCIFSLLCFQSRSIIITTAQADSATCESSERFKTMKSQLALLTRKNEELSKKLLLAQQDNDKAQYKPGPFGTVKGTGKNPTILPNKSVNPRLAKTLEEISVHNEFIVALANSNMKEILQVWFTNIRRVGIQNYLVVALDENIESFCRERDVPVYRWARDDRTLDSVPTIGLSHAVSGLKFRVLRDFLQLGYSVLLSDIDIVFLQNPFEFIYRDCDVESMTDGHDNVTAYGYDDVFDDPLMGWSRFAHTMRIWVYNSGFFYIRPTIPAIELLDRVSYRLAHEPGSWDQTVFNEELFYPSYPGYNGLHASKRTMDIYLFMNSKILFKIVRKDPQLSKSKPVIVHLNYHPDKLLRMRAVVEFYVNGKQDALDSFSDGTQ